MLYNKTIKRGYPQRKGELKMEISRFEGHKKAKAFFVKDNYGNVAMYSYNTQVVYIDSDGWLTISGLYSRTTIKHIGWFAKSIGTTYQTLKHLYLHNEKMNVRTGEVVTNKYE
jgi:hypothetical protein